MNGLCLVQSLHEHYYALYVLHVFVALLIYISTLTDASQTTPGTVIVCLHVLWPGQAAKHTTLKGLMWRGAWRQHDDNMAKCVQKRVRWPCSATEIMRMHDVRSRRSGVNKLQTKRMSLLTRTVSNVQSCRLRRLYLFLLPARRSLVARGSVQKQGRRGNKGYTTYCCRTNILILCNCTRIMRSWILILIMDAHIRRMIMWLICAVVFP